MEKYLDLFKRFVWKAVDIGKYDLEYPRTSFMTIFSHFEREVIKGDLDCEDVQEKHDFFTRLFVLALEEKGETIDLASAHRFVITEDMRKGAQAAEHHHRQVLGDQY